MWCKRGGVLTTYVVLSSQNIGEDFWSGGSEFTSVNHGVSVDFNSR